MLRVRLEASTGFVSTGSVLERVEDTNHGAGRNACDIYAMEDALEKLRQRLIPQQQLCFNAGKSVAGGAQVVRLSLQSECVNGIGVAFEQNSEGVHSVLRLFPGLRCISGQILPGDMLLLVNGTAVTGLADSQVSQLIQTAAKEGSQIALTLVPKSALKVESNPT